MTQGSITLALGDSTDLTNSVPSDSVALVLTDPPYGLGLFTKSRGNNLQGLRAGYFSDEPWEQFGDGEWDRLIDKTLRNASRIVAQRGAIVLFAPIFKIETVKRLAEKYDLYYKTTGIWHKTNPMPRNKNLHFINATEHWTYLIKGGRTGTFNNDGRVQHDIITLPTAPKAERVFGKHPTQKPKMLMRHFISLLSNPGDLVFDPFMGSGTTGVAALELGRRFFGYELNQEYFNIASARITAQMECQK